MSAQFATFGMGCFWCSEAIFSRLPGVTRVTSGYMGGTVPNPTYEEVCSGDSGYIEVVQVEFDDSIVPYTTLLKIFWRLHNPTTRDKQGADTGSQYRSVIFFHTDEQKKIAERSKIEVQHIYDEPIVTEIIKATLFYPAESYHQDFYRKNSESAYCQYVINPKLEKLASLLDK